MYLDAGEPKIGKCSLWWVVFKKSIRNLTQRWKFSMQHSALIRKAVLEGRSRWWSRGCRAHLSQSESESRSVASKSLQLHGLYSPWNSPGQNTRVVSFSLLQGIFPTQGLNPGLLHCRQFLYQLSYQGSPIGRPISFIIVHKSMVFLDVSADLSWTGRAQLDIWVQLLLVM